MQGRNVYAENPGAGLPLASPRKEKMLCRPVQRGSTPSHGLLFTRETLRGFSSLFFQEKAYLLLFLDLIPADSSLEAHTAPRTASSKAGMPHRAYSLFYSLHKTLRSVFGIPLCFCVYLNLQANGS